MLNTRDKTHAKNNQNHIEICSKQLQELEQTIDWNALVKDTFPYYIKSNISPILLTVENMLRIYVLGRYFKLTPRSLKIALLQYGYLKDFILIDSDNDVIPSTFCIADFNSILEEKNLAIKIEKALSSRTCENECLALH